MQVSRIQTLLEQTWTHEYASRHRRAPALQANLSFKDMRQMGDDLEKIQTRRRKLENPTVQKAVAARYMDFIQKQSANVRTDYVRPTVQNSSVLCQSFAPTLPTRPPPSALLLANFDASLFRPPRPQTTRQPVPEIPQMQLRPQTTKPRSESKMAEHQRVYQAFQSSRALVKKSQRPSTVTSVQKRPVSHEAEHKIVPRKRMYSSKRPVVNSPSRKDADGDLDDDRPVLMSVTTLLQRKSLPVFKAPERVEEIKLEKPQKKRNAVEENLRLFAEK